MWRPNYSFGIPCTEHRPPSHPSIHPPATINHDNLYTITNDYKSSVCCFTHAQKHYFIHNIVVRCKKSSDAQYNKTTWTFSYKKCALQTQALLAIVSVQSARLITAVVSFLSGSGSRYAIKFLIWDCIMSILAPNITTRWYFKLLV